MLLRKQKDLYNMSKSEESNLIDIVLVAINEITKSDPAEDSRENVGIDISNMVPFNPYMVTTVLHQLGYADDDDEDNFETNGWVHDYWINFTSPDRSKFPPIQVSGTSFIHQCYIHGIDDDDNTYPHLDDNAELAKHIQHGYELLKTAYTRPI